METFIHSMNEKTIMIDTDSDVSIDDIIKSFMNEHNGIDKQVKEIDLVLNLLLV